MKRGWEAVTTGEKRTKGRMLTTSGIRFIGVPIVFVLECIIITVPVP